MTAPSPDPGGDSPQPCSRASWDAEGVPATPRHDTHPPPSQGCPSRSRGPLSPEELQLTLPASRGKAGVWVSGLSLLSSPRATHRSRGCPGFVLLWPSKQLILESAPHGKPGSSSSLPQAVCRPQQTSPPLVAHSSCPGVLGWDPQMCTSRCFSTAWSGRGCRTP